MASEVYSLGQQQQQQQQQSQQELNHKFFTSQIDDEVAGFNERGIKAPQVRIPGKTHLSGVLLIANPWEDRDLDRKLSKIKKERIQKERTLEWNQRQFFINQIFDQDLNLRFNKLLLEDKNRHQAQEELNQYYNHRDSVPPPAGGTSRMVSRSSFQGQGLFQGQTYNQGQSYYPMNTTDGRITAGNYGTNFSGHGNMDENGNQMSLEDSGTSIGNGRSSKKAKKAKLEKKKTSASMGIFAPPLNPKPKTKIQRDKLIKKHAVDDNVEETDRDRMAEEVEVKSTMSETTNVPVTNSETNKEANLKLRLPVLFTTKDGEFENKTEDKENNDDSDKNASNSKPKELNNSAAVTKEAEPKDATYLTTRNENSEETKNEPLDNIAEEAEIQFTVPETIPKSRLDFDMRTHGVVLPDIRINNYTVPSPIQEEEEERISSVLMEEQRAESVAKKLGNGPKKSPLSEMTLNLPPDLIPSLPATPHGRPGPSLPPTPHGRPGYISAGTTSPYARLGTPGNTYRPPKSRNIDYLSLSRQDTRLSSRLFTGNQGDEFDANQSATTSPTSRHSSALLEGDVITRLTRTLPETLMIKANQNINKIIDKRKQRMLRKARDNSSRNTLEDPRWRKLTSALSEKFSE